LLGYIAIRLLGRTLRWNSAGLRCEGDPQADRLVRRRPRDGWQLSGLGRPRDGPASPSGFLIEAFKDSADWQLTDRSLDCLSPVVFGPPPTTKDPCAA